MFATDLMNRNPNS